MTIKMKVVSNDNDIGLQLESNQEDIGMETDVVQKVSTDNYKDLRNKPTINGSYPEYKQTLVTNYDEVDPTVPSWAKAETKPEYTAEEIGAIDENNEIPLADLKAMLDGIFKGE